MEKVIQTLPDIVKDWLKEERIRQYGEMFLPKEVNTDQLDKIKAFTFDESDILVSTYPRSGTTWTQEIVWLVCNNADIDAANTKPLFDRSRFIEFKMKEKSELEMLEATAPPRIIKSHFPPQFFETQTEGSRVKTIIVMRNLKDVMTSHFHMYTDLSNFKGNWNDFFEIFKKDAMWYGSWAKHSLKCWELRDDPNVLILRYEDMKMNPFESTKRIAKFCGKALSDEQITSIVDYTSFRSQKKKLDSWEMVKKDPKYKQFIRKGVIGDWVELFTDEQEEYVSDLLRSTTEKKGLVFTDK